MFMADGSVAGPPVSHERFRFVPKFVGPCDDATTIRLETMVRQLPDDGDLILKMDIEGGEYHALLDAAPETLTRFRMMLIAFHGLGGRLNPPASDLLFATFEQLLETQVVRDSMPQLARSSVRLGWPSPFRRHRVQSCQKRFERTAHATVHRPLASPRNRQSPLLGVACRTSSSWSKISGSCLVARSFKPR